MKIPFSSNRLSMEFIKSFKSSTWAKTFVAVIILALPLESKIFSTTEWSKKSSKVSMPLFSERFVKVVLYLIRQAQKQILLLYLQRLQVIYLKIIVLKLAPETFAASINKTLTLLNSDIFNRDCLQ